MALTGQAKKDYQREYMRKRSKKHRNNSRSKVEGLTPYPRVSDQDFTRLLATLPPGSPTVRVSKPGDVDYEPQCETTKAFVEGKTVTKAESHVDASDIGTVKALHCLIPKRGLDIKCFEDLPPDVQETIRSISQSNEEFQRRTQIAITYQHTFPGRY